MAKQLIKNIKALVQVGEHFPPFLKGAEMKNLPIIEDAFIAKEDGVIVEYGKMSEWGGILDWRDVEIIDAEEEICPPCLL